MPDLSTITPQQLLEWAGAVTGVAGSFIMAQNRKWSTYAWPIWIASNICLIAFAALDSAYGILSMQLVFLAINLQGAWRWRHKQPLKN